VIPAAALHYERTVAARGPAPVVVVADAPLLAHTQAGFEDVRVVDADGREVPWRVQSAPAPTARRVALVDVGTRGSTAVARFRVDGPLGNRVDLDVPDARFDGSVTVLGSDDRESWTALSTTQIYSVGGAEPARSTTALVPPAVFRWIELRATGVSRIDGATIEPTNAPDPLRHVPARFDGRVLHLRYAAPVEQLRISAGPARYSRPFRVVAGDGREVAYGRLVRTHGTAPTIVPVSVRAHDLRIVVVNGDDPPLRGLRVDAYAPRRSLVLEGGHPGPLTLYYGGAVPAPDYEFMRLPLGARPQASALGPERPNPGYHVVDTRSFFTRHRSLVTAALALAAALLVAAGGLALRRT
jgi:hypothetical protein